MRDFARVFGVMNLAAGVVLVAFPGLARQIGKVRAEFLELSDGALRLLGFWELVMGATLLGTAARPEVETMVREALARGRQAAGH
jgi:uncharacterized protein YjeT (DUF2065 family)